MALSASTPQHLHKIGLLGEIQNDKGMIFFIYINNPIISSSFIELLDNYAYIKLH